MNKSREEVVECLEKKLGLSRVDSVAPGHMGASVVRFRRAADGRQLIAKFCCSGDPATAREDIAANIAGYQALIKMGAGMIVPPEYSVEVVAGIPVLVMADLGSNFFTAVERGGVSLYEQLRDNFRNAVTATLRPNEFPNRDTAGASEVPFHCGRFLEPLRSLFAVDTRAFTQPLPPFQGACAAFMPLDFTPDNVFVSAERLSFIDPWPQKTYSGHPAVSIGQFVTLARDIYQCHASSEGGKLLTAFALEELPSFLGGTSPEAERAFQAGSALQYLLSAYVRRDRFPDQARIFVKKAITHMQLARSSAAGGVT